MEFRYFFDSRRSREGQGERSRLAERGGFSAEREKISAEREKFPPLGGNFSIGAENLPSGANLRSEVCLDRREPGLPVAIKKFCLSVCLFVCLSSQIFNHIGRLAGPIVLNFSPEVF